MFLAFLSVQSGVCRSDKKETEYSASSQLFGAVLNCFSPADCCRTVCFWLDLGRYLDLTAELAPNILGVGQHYCISALCMNFLEHHKQNEAVK